MESTTSNFCSRNIYTIKEKRSLITLVKCYGYLLRPKIYAVIIVLLVVVFSGRINIALIYCAHRNKRVKCALMAIIFFLGKKELLFKLENFTTGMRRNTIAEIKKFND